jgi:hypothetical protein
VILGNPESRRVALFQSALGRLGLPAASVVPWSDFLADRVRLDEVLRPGSILRIESPGQNFEVEKAFLALGADGRDPMRRGLSLEEALALEFDKGRIWPTGQWYRGFRVALRRIDGQLAASPSRCVMNATDAIAVLFDKAACHARLQEEGLPVPRALGTVHSFEELLARMRAAGWLRVFIKPSHGSSASGVVALACHSTGAMAAYTPVEMVCEGGERKLFNSRKLRHLEDRREIAPLVDELCRDPVHVEKWLPKASTRDGSFDLRVMVVGGRPGHVVVRTSRTPLTNLHLGNCRGSADALRRRMGPSRWDAALCTCADAVATFPGCHYCGVDLLIAPGDRRHAILELNAFGDLLPGILENGLDTYSTEILSFVPHPASRATVHPPAGSPPLDAALAVVGP